VPTVEELLRDSALPHREAQILVAYAVGIDRAALAAHPERQIDADLAAAVESLFSRRRSGEPVAYLTGEREFYGLALRVTPAVLIPRPETELLVEVALEHLGEGERALELGTGSGAVAIALALARPESSVIACDNSDTALEIARLNAERHGARVTLIRSEWFSALEGERFHLIAANPPYVASADPHLERGDLRFEPRSALDAGPTGLEQIGAIARESRRHLFPGGWLALEHGYDQGPECERLLAKLGFSEVSDRRDLAGLPRVVIARFDRVRTGQ